MKQKEFNKGFQPIVRSSTFFKFHPPSLIDGLNRHIKKNKKILPTHLHPSSLFQQPTSSSPKNDKKKS